MFRWILIVLLPVFLLLFIFNPLIFSIDFQDVWANLLAGVFTALVIDRIVKLSAIERRKPSMIYVNRKLADVCFRLANNLAPVMHHLEYGYLELEWRHAIKKEYDAKQWAEYYERIKKTRESSLDNIRYIVENQRDLLNDKLQNDVFDLLRMLEKSDWDLWFNDIRKDIWKLCYIAELSSLTLIISLKIIKENNLLDYYRADDLLLDTKTKEFPSFKLTSNWQMTADFSRLEQFEDESVEFLLAIRKKLSLRIS